MAQSSPAAENINPGGIDHMGVSIIDHWLSHKKGALSQRIDLRNLNKGLLSGRFLLRRDKWAMHLQA